MAGQVEVIGENGLKLRMTNHGEAIIGAHEHGKPHFSAMIASNTAYNFLVPIKGKAIIITDVIVQAGKTVSPTTAGTIDIYEAASDTDATIAKSIFEFDMIRYDQIVMTGLNVELSEGIYVNAKTTDPTVLCTIIGYHIPIYRKLPEQDSI